VLFSSNTTRHFILLDVAKGREIPSVSHSKRKACRVHINKQETCDPSFLKVSRTRNSAATKFCHFLCLLLMELLLWRTKEMCFMSVHML